MGKLGNTLAMLKILETGRKYTVNELASKIEVSPRMIKTYKTELEKAGIYILIQLMGYMVDMFIIIKIIMMYLLVLMMLVVLRKLFLC